MNYSYFVLFKTISLTQLLVCVCVCFSSPECMVFSLIMLSDLRNCQNDGDVYESLLLN